MWLIIHSPHKCRCLKKSKGLLLNTYSSLLKLKQRSCTNVASLSHLQPSSLLIMDNGHKQGRYSPFCQNKNN